MDEKIKEIIEREATEFVIRVEKGFDAYTRKNPGDATKTLNDKEMINAILDQVQREITKTVSSPTSLNACVQTIKYIRDKINKQ